MSKPRNLISMLIAVGLVVCMLSGCAVLCPSMDDNCWLIRHMDHD